MDTLHSILCCVSTKPPPVAEIDGGTLSIHDPSVFLHIERGLRSNPHGLAVISTHQARDHLSTLIGNYINGSLNGRTKSKRIQSELQAVSETNTNASTNSETCLSWTYTQLHRAALRVAGGLLAHGAKGNGTETILMLIPNGIEYTVLLWMSVIMRLTIVSLDLSYLSAPHYDELREMLRTLKPTVVAVQGAKEAAAVDTALRNLAIERKAGGVIGVTLSEEVVKSKITWRWKSLVSYANASILSATDTVSLLAAARSDDPSRTFSVLFTSGTSGKPKGCPLLVSGTTHVLQSQSWLLATPKDPSPLFALQQPHNARGIAPAQTLQTWREGGTVVMTGDGFDCRLLVEAIDKQRVSFIVLTPTMVHGVAAALERQSKLGIAEVDVSCVRTIQVGGDAVTRDTLESIGRLFPDARVVVNHGMTEGSGAFWWSFPQAHRKANSTGKLQGRVKVPFYGEMSPVGTVAPGASVRIWNGEEGVMARRGELGDLHVSVGSLIPGYLLGVSRESFYEEGGRRWFDTGDVAMMDGKGVVFILGRRKDLMRVCGGIIMPAPIESVLEKFTSTQACVVNVDGPFAVLERYTDKTEAQIKRHVTTTLGKQYSLRGITYLKDLELKKFPVNATHKIIRSEVEEAVSSYLSQNLNLS
ncbi:hypothetical protein BDW69DRAFT_201651 [Aspergillus filifer]